MDSSGQSLSTFATEMIIIAKNIQVLGKFYSFMNYSFKLFLRRLVSFQLRPQDISVDEIKILGGVAQNLLVKKEQTERLYSLPYMSKEIAWPRPVGNAEVIT